MADGSMGAERPIVTRAEAIREGRPRYFTGKLCKNGHIAERGTANGSCLVCAYSAEVRYRERNPEKFREKNRRQLKRLQESASESWRQRRRAANRKYAAANKGKIAEKTKRWAENNYEKRLEQGRRYRKRHLEKRRANVRKWRDQNRHKEVYKQKAISRVLRWIKENPEGVRKNTHARRARAKGATGSHTKEQLLEILKRQKWKCAEDTCRASLRKHRHLDHIEALTKGGTNNASNLQYLCPTCNCRKHNKDPIVWAQENGRLL